MGPALAQPTVAYQQAISTERAVGGGFATTLTGVAPGRPFLCAYARDLPTARSVLIACWYATVG